MPRRAKITITFEVDLDCVPGYLHQPEDWVELIASRNVSFMEQTHYNPSYTVHGVTLNDNPITFFGRGYKCESSLRYTVGGTAEEALDPTKYSPWLIRDAESHKIVAAVYGPASAMVVAAERGWDTIDKVNQCFKSKG